MSCATPASNTTSPTGPDSDARLPPDGGEVILVRDPGSKYDHILRRDCSAPKALRRGLAEYLGARRLSIKGAEHRFTKVYPEWPELPEEVPTPSAGIVTLNDGEFDAASLTPNTVGTEIAPKRYLVKASEFVQDIGVDISCRDNTERDLMETLLEDALNPVEWMYGFRLWLPFYFGSIAKYELLGYRDMDDAAAVAQRDRSSIFVLRGTLSVYRLGTFEQGRTRLQLDTLDPTDPVT